VTLLPRHAPSWWGQSVTHPLGICCYLTLGKDTIVYGNFVADRMHVFGRFQTHAIASLLR
jgi:hypothetical protein